jgi:MoaA/NifB/PqqE/SkfB family radical SAM enzyme
MMTKGEDSLQMVVLETTQRCNLRCIHCAVSEENNQGGYAWEDLSLEFFNKLLPILNAHRPWVHLSGHGETLMHPKFWEMLEATIGAGCKVKFQTNGTLLTRERVDRIIELGVELIVVSLDAASSELFDRIRRRAKLERILAHLAYLQEAKRRMGSNRPALEIEFVAMRQNIHELPEVIALAAKLGARHVGVTELAEYNLTVGQSLKGDPILAEWVDKADAEAKKRNIAVSYSITMPAKETTGCTEAPEPSNALPAGHDGLRKNCREPWERIFVKHDGKVLPCCYINEPHGDLTVQSFDELWDGEKYRALREGLLGDHPRRECENCPAYAWEPITINDQVAQPIDLKTA